MKRSIVTMTLALILLTTLFMGCATSVGRIAQDPQAYNGKNLKIKGEAGKGFSIPLTEISVFLLKGDEGSVPIVALSKPSEGDSVAVRGTVWAFPQEGMNASTTQAVQAVEDFLVDNDLVDRKKARDASALVLTAVGKLAEGLGHVWFVIEEK